MLFDVLFTNATIARGQVHHAQVRADTLENALTAADLAADELDYIISVTPHTADFVY
jgi:hypothetical protein